MKNYLLLGMLLNLINTSVLFASCSSSTSLSSNIRDHTKYTYLAKIKNDFNKQKELEENYYDAINTDIEEMVTKYQEIIDASESVLDTIEIRCNTLFHSSIKSAKELDVVYREYLKIIDNNISQLDDYLQEVRYTIREKLEIFAAYNQHIGKIGDEIEDEQDLYTKKQWNTIIIPLRNTNTRLFNMMKKYQKQKQLLDDWYIQTLELQEKEYTRVYSQALEDTASKGVLSLENLIVNSKALQPVYYNIDEMEELATTRRAIRKAVIDLRDSIKEARRNEQYQNLDSDPEQIATKLETKLELFTEALKKFCDTADEEDTILQKISMVFKQLSLILNNETKNIDNIGEQSNDNYQLNYLFKNILQKNYDVSGDNMSIDVLNLLIEYLWNSEQSPNEFLNTISKSMYVTSDGSNLNFDECIDDNNVLSFRQLAKEVFEIKANDGERITELNEAISDAINEVKDKHLLETLDVLMSLIIKASKNIEVAVQVSENEEENEKENNEKQNINNEDENEGQNSDGEEEEEYEENAEGSNSGEE